MRTTALSRLLIAALTTLSLHATAAPTPASPASHPSSPPINLNTADAPTLQKSLSGIGQTKAEAIVAYREAHGPFHSVDELLEVNGIGTSLVDRNRPILTTE